MPPPSPLLCVLRYADIHHGDGLQEAFYTSDKVSMASPLERGIPRRANASVAHATTFAPGDGFRQAAGIEWRRCWRSTRVAVRVTAAPRMRSELRIEHTAIQTVENIGNESYFTLI